MHTVVYYDRQGEEIQREEIEGMDRQAITDWLNDNNLQQTCEFDTFEILG
jgi:hypothetical protein